MDRQLIAVLDAFTDGVNIGEIESGIHALAVHVERKIYDVDVSSPLPISEEATLDSIGACHDGELRGSSSGATIIVRMNGKNHFLSVS